MVTAFITPLFSLLLFILPHSTTQSFLLPQSVPSQADSHVSCALPRLESWPNVLAIIMRDSFNRASACGELPFPWWPCRPLHLVHSAYSHAPLPLSRRQIDQVPVPLSSLSMPTAIDTILHPLTHACIISFNESHSQSHSNPAPTASASYPDNQPTINDFYDPSTSS